MSKDVVDFHMARLKASAQVPMERGRMENHAVLALRQFLAFTEDAEEAVVASYGLGALLSLCLSQLQRGDHIAVADQCFGGVTTTFDDFLQGHGVGITYVSGNALDAWQQALCPRTKMVFASIGITDVSRTSARFIRDLSSVVRDNSSVDAPIQLVIENSSQGSKKGPYGKLQPLNYGADYVLYMSMDWAQTYSRSNQASGYKVVAGAISGSAHKIAQVQVAVNNARVCINPFNAWTLLQALNAREVVRDRKGDVYSSGDTGTIVVPLGSSRDMRREYQVP